MDVVAVIVEQLDIDGTLRTFRMQADYDERITVAFADEYDEPRSGPFHFLDDRHERAFQRAFAECKVRKLTTSRFKVVDGQYVFETSWAGIPTERQRLSYYALSLPENAIPTVAHFFDPRSGRAYRKHVVRDDHRRRFVLYLECRSSYGSFDFVLEVRFLVDPTVFIGFEYKDETTSPYSAYVDAYEYLLPSEQQLVVQQFFSERVRMGDQYTVGQAGAVGPNSKAENFSLQQVWNQTERDVDLDALASDLALLRSAMRKEATELHHDKAVAEVAAAEDAAKRQDGTGALQHLKSAGKWAFDIATKIGTTVAAKVIEKAMGL